MHNNFGTICLVQTHCETLCKTMPVKGKKQCRMHGGMVLAHLKVIGMHLNMVVINAIRG